MNQYDFSRRVFLQGMAATAGAAAATKIAPALADGHAIRLWSAPIMRPFKTWEPFEEKAGISISWSPKSASADEALSKMMVGDGKKL